ncbi:hypothetical protein HJFPF1_13612 [Paramyrothecium foliicola]|nr:hypothetical protein HJFPF1_13612 [Paramyrothecium foliicola]
MDNWALEALTTTIALSHTSPRSSYAEVARTPPDSNTSNMRPLSSFRTGPSDWSDTLYYTIDVSRTENAESDSTAPSAIRTLIKTEVRTELGQSNWRCRAMTKDQKNKHHIRIACRNEDEHSLVKRVAETKVPRGARVLRDELYPIKVDNVNRLAVIDEFDGIRPEAAETFSRENDMQVAKVVWLSKRDIAKAYRSMVIYLKKASDAKKALQEGFFYAGGESGYTGPFERRARPE